MITCEKCGKTVVTGVGDSSICADCADEATAKAHTQQLRLDGAWSYAMWVQEHGNGSYDHWAAREADHADTATALSKEKAITVAKYALDWFKKACPGWHSGLEEDYQMAMRWLTLMSDRREP